MSKIVFRRRPLSRRQKSRLYIYNYQEFCIEPKDIDVAGYFNKYYKQYSFNLGKIRDYYSGWLYYYSLHQIPKEELAKLVKQRYPKNKDMNELVMELL